MSRVVPSVVRWGCFCVLTTYVGARVFAQSGVVDLSFDPGSGPAGVLGYVQQLEVLPNNKILVAGSFESFNGQARTHLVLHFGSSNSIVVQVSDDLRHW